MILNDISVSLWNRPTALFFLLNPIWLPLPILYMSKKASNLSIWEQIQRPFQRLKLNILKTLSFWCTSNHSNWHFIEWTFFYTRRPWITLASLNPINADPCNENAAYWMMNVVCWLAYKMVYLGRYLWI